VERFVRTRHGLRVWTERFGDRAAPPVLLVMGGGAQGIAWPDALCTAIADAGYRVVRYDHRDAGRSSRADDHRYGLQELAEDAADVVLDLGDQPVHVVGQSMGGMVALLLALRFPDLVGSLVLLSSSSDAQVSPSPSRAEPQELTRSLPDRIEAEVAMWRSLVGPDAPFSEAYWYDLAARSMARTNDLDALRRHRAALERTPPLTGMLPRIHVPTLVVHGWRDPVFPIEHGRVLSQAIPSTRLVEVESLGHIFPPQWSPFIGGLVLEHLGATASWRAAGGEERPMKEVTDRGAAGC
jgi:pimeloyl-ACP methyl ester carboxylesterase